MRRFNAEIIPVSNKFVNLHSGRHWKVLEQAGFMVCCVPLTMADVYVSGPVQINALLPAFQKLFYLRATVSFTIQQLSNGRTHFCQLSGNGI